MGSKGQRERKNPQAGSGRSDLGLSLDPGAETRSRILKQLSYLGALDLVFKINLFWIIFRFIEKLLR